MRDRVRELVRKWRTDVAMQQNTELERAGVDKRYDPRSYGAQRIDLEATTHHGASRSALKASARGALHWNAEAAREWDRIAQEVESYLEVEGLGPVDGERVREVLEELRLEAGLTASDGHPDGARVAHMFRSALVPVGEEEPQRHPAARRPIEAIDDARREVRAGVRQPAWMIAWQGVQRTEPDPIRLGATADVIARGYPGDVEALAADTRPKARSFVAAARRIRGVRAQWVWSGCAKPARWTRSRAAERQERSSRECERKGSLRVWCLRPPTSNGSPTQAAKGRRPRASETIAAHSRSTWREAPIRTMPRMRSCSFCDRTQTPWNATRAARRRPATNDSCAADPAPHGHRRYGQRSVGGNAHREAGRMSVIDDEGNVQVIARQSAPCIRPLATPPKSSVTKNAVDATWCASIRARPNANASIVPKR